MLDVNQFVQLINGVGFPIAACIAMAVYIVWDRKEQRKAKEERKAQNDETLKKNEEMYSKLADAVNNNTEIVEQLARRLGGI